MEKKLGLPWWHWGLRIRHCHCVGVGLTPGLGNAAGWVEKDKKKSEKKGNLKKKKKKKALTILKP